MARKKTQVKRRRHSLILGMLNRFTAFIYTLLGNNRMIGDLLSGDRLYKESYCGRYLEKNSSTSKLLGLRYADRVIEQSRSLRAVGRVREFFASLGLNVYGVFFMTYSLSAAFVYYISLMLDGAAIQVDYVMAVLLTTFICSIPLLVTSRSFLGVLSESKLAQNLLIGYFGLPKENLRSKKQINGTELMFLSAVFALLFGLMTFVIHPAYVPAIFALIAVVILVSASPEAGFVLTVTVTPFLQFIPMARGVLVGMILLTAFSYGNKLVRRKRTITMSAESVIMILFCAFLLAASSFAHGGLETFYDAILTVIIILGGFFLSYNLMQEKNRIVSCTILMTITYLILCMAGLWNLFYNGIADGMMYSIREDLRPIFDSNIIYLADDASVFGVYSVLIAPLIFAYGAKQKDAQGAAAGIILLVVLVGTTLIYGSFEAIAALFIEFCIFWMLYSHKSLTALILCSLPVAIFALLYPPLSEKFGFYNIREAIENMLPLPLTDSSIHKSAVENTLQMLKDGKFFGIGAGQHAFTTCYPAYSDVVSAGISSAPTLWLKVLCWSGIGGFLAFAAFLLQMLRSSLTFMLRSRESEIRREILALSCSVFAAVLFGAVNGVWDDPRMLYLFWVNAGLLAGALHVGKNEQVQVAASFASKEEHTDLELHFQ